jgi:hypothetical protein
VDLLSELTAEKPTAEVYHYTSASGLVGIANEKALWATSHLHLNDSMEHEIALRLLEEGVREADLSDKQRRVFSFILDLFREPFYVASFSERGNLLSQWRAYGGQGVGYSIGFAPNNPLFHSAAAASFNLVRCRYEHEEQKRLARALVSTFVEEYWSSLTDKDAETPDSIRAFFRQYQWRFILALFISACKHNAFSDEREWRLVSQHPDYLADKGRIRFRPGRFGVVPYFPIPLHQDDLKPRLDSITIGPAFNEEASRKALDVLAITHLDKDYVDAQGRKVPQIIASAIPYRP